MEGDMNETTNWTWWLGTGFRNSFPKWIDLEAWYDALHNGTATDAARMLATGTYYAHFVHRRPRIG